MIAKKFERLGKLIGLACAVLVTIAADDTFPGAGVHLGDHGNWHVDMVQPLGMRGSACVLSSDPSDGARLVIQRNSPRGPLAGKLTLRVWVDSWSLEKDYPYSGTFTVRGYPGEWSGPAITEEHSMNFLIPEQNATTFWAAFRMETTMSFSTRQFWRDWPLSGSAQAFTDMTSYMQIQDHTG
jgi:hypothetical protein